MFDNWNYLFIEFSFSLNYVWFLLSNISNWRSLPTRYYFRLFYVWPFWFWKKKFWEKIVFLNFWNISKLFLFFVFELWMYFQDCTRFLNNIKLQGRTYGLTLTRWTGNNEMLIEKKTKKKFEKTNFYFRQM